jgi:heptosyltransferase-2
MVELVPFTAPWTAFRGKYNLARWPWREIRRVARGLRSRRFDVGVSARPDPRDHALLAVSGAKQRLGFARAGSALLLTKSVTRPARVHRADHWESIAAVLEIRIEAKAPVPRRGRRIVIHTGAGQPARLWPHKRFENLASALARSGWEPEILDDSLVGIEALLDKLASADRFIGNDSGPGHLAALLGVPTFTIFGPQLPELFAPRHPDSQWIEGAPCRYKPCRDYCRFPEPRCLTALEVEPVLARIHSWLST